MAELLLRQLGDAEIVMCIHRPNMEVLTGHADTGSTPALLLPLVDAIPLLFNPIQCIASVLHDGNRALSDG